MPTTQRRRRRSGSRSDGGIVVAIGRPSRRKKSFHSDRGSRRPQGERRGGRGRGRVQPTFDPSQFINTNPAPTKEEVFVAKHSFHDFGLRKDLVQVIEGLGITTPSPIQDEIIEPILQNRDVIGLAETGTGKTAAFLIPLIEKTRKDQQRQTLILTPTRELAIQIEQELRRLTPHMHIYSTVCVGGTNIRPQIQKLKRKNHFVIATPGRILDLIERKHFRTDRLSTIVLDEADRMLDMGFIHDMRKILSLVPAERETLFFSATMNKDTEALTHEFLNDPITISVKKRDVTNSIKQDVVHYEHAHKFDHLLELLSQKEFNRVIIFGAMKHSVEKLANELVKHGIDAESIHGNKNHQQRQRSLTRFKRGEARVLVATDVAARGIHVDDVSHVINYDLPNTFEDYVHRIGRTGRGTKRGQALTFVPAA